MEPVFKDGLRTCMGDSASISLMPPSDASAPGYAPDTPRTPRFLQTSLLASIRFPTEKPVPSSPPGAFRRLLTCVTLALALGAALVAGGLAIASKGGKGDAEVQNPNDSVSTVSASTEERSTIVNDPIATVGDNSKLSGADTEADMHSSASTLQHSIDSYLRSLQAAKTADTIRKQGFEIKATESPQPLLEQPHAAQVSTENFKYNYLEAWFKSLLMFEIQRGGTQAPDSRTWRQNDATAADAATVGAKIHNMDGGWWEAGNHLKVTIPTGYVVARLAWMCEYYHPTLSNLRFSGGGATDFGSAGTRNNDDLFRGKSAYEWCRREVHWGASWLRNATIVSPDGTLEGLVVQCGISRFDHQNVLNSEKIEAGPRVRPCGVANEHRPATADAAQLAAGLAAASRMFSRGTSAEKRMSKDWMMAAKKALDFAVFHNGGKDVWWEDDKLYATSMLADHVFYAEASIFLASVATGDSAAADVYFDAAMTSYITNTDLQYRCSVTLSNWDAPCALAMLMMVQGSGDYTSWFAIQLARQYTDAYVGTEDPSSRQMVGRGDITITPKGARIFNPADSASGELWATLRASAEAGSIAALVADFPGIENAMQTRYRCLAASQINYILGDTGRSFVVGVGKNYPKAPHTRDGFCAIDMDEDDCDWGRWSQKSRNPQVVVGAMVAGPNLKDAYEDTRQNYWSSEIAIDFQAGFVSVLTAALTMPAGFWHNGSLTELEAYCDVVGYKYYNWDS